MPEHLRAAALTVAVVAVFTVSSSALRAQDVTQVGENYQIQFDEIEGTPLEDFIKLCEIITEKQLTYSPSDTKDIKLRFVGVKVLAMDQFWSYFQAVLKAHDFVVVPYGNIGAPGRPLEGPDTGFFAIRRTAGGVGGAAKPGYIKSQAPVVSVEQLEYFKYDPGIVLTTSFTLRYVNVQEAMNMLQTYFTDPMLESVRAVGNSNSLVATGFAQTLYGIKQLIDLIDTKPDEYTPQFAKIELEFAVAEEIQPIVKELIDAERGVSPTGARNVPAGGASGLPAALQEPDPQVSADPRTNSLLVIAASKSLEKITSYIRVLDVEVDPRGDTHVYRLKNSASKDLEEILGEWAQNAGTGTGGGGGGGDRGGAAGGQGTARGSLEQPVTVVADEASNSLIITASKSRYAQILEIVKKLDVRRRQVLIECALIEITGTLSERLGVELADIPDQNGDYGWGLSSFGFSTLQDTDGDGIVDFRLPSGLTPDSTGLPGLTTGIFSGDNFALPFLLSALKSTGDINVLSQPSVLVNDNEKAIISTTDERPTFTVNQGVNSDQTSFNDFEEAGITLNISPSISAGNYLRLTVKLEVSTFTEPEGNPPPKATRMIETSVTLPDGHTMVCGGMVQDDERGSVDMVPWLGEMPLFGWLFSSNFDQNNRTNLYVFITPHIISDDFATLDDISYLKKKEMEALNGKIHLVDPDWDRDNADTRVLDAGVSGIFDLPAYASPPAGEVEEAPAPAEPVEENPIPTQYGDLPPEGGGGQ